jgi:hypothetical protein
MRTLSMVAIGAFLVVAESGTALAGTGTAEFWGAVTANGVISRGSGISTATRTGTGAYLATFPRDVNTCLGIGTIVGKTGGQISLSAVGGQPQQLTINTFAATGAAANRAFNIVVTCQD